MATRSSRRLRKKRSTTLDPTCDIDINYSSHSLSKSPKPDKKLRNTKSKTASKNKKNARRRATSNAPLKPQIAPITLSFDTKTKSKSKLKLKLKAKPKTKKSKKYVSQTPVNDYVGSSFNNADPFGVHDKKQKKKSSMTPKVSLSTSIEESLFSSDDELNGAYNNTKNKNTKNKKITNNNATIINGTSNHAKLNNSKSIATATKDLNSINTNIKNEINDGFKQFHKALNQKESKLLFELESVYNEKKEEIIFIEEKLFENGKKSKNIKPKEYEFNADMNLVMDKNEILSHIDKYGYINGAQNEYKNDQKDEQMNNNNGNQSMATKQKLILYEIQKKTMNKLDVVILMEKEAQQKSKEAQKLTLEVDEQMRAIALRTKIINEKIAVATPELEKAREAVSGIHPKDINEIKTLKSPPNVIECVITATVMLLGHKIKQWRDVQKLLSYKFKPQLLNFDTYTLSKATRQKVYKKYASKDDFNYDRVYEASKVCGNLVLWVLSQINYSRMLDVIIPLEKEVKKLKKESKKKQKLAKQLMKIVKELEDNIKLYTNQCNQMIDHIIKSTDYELKQFSDKLQPLNEKFNQLLSNKVLD